MSTEEKPKNGNGDPAPSREVAVRTADPKYDRFARLGQWLAAAEGSTEKDARGRNGMAAAYRIAAADELGLSPLAAGELFVQNGRLRVQALLLRAIAEGRGYQVEPKEMTAETCTAVLKRDGKVVGESTFTIQDAIAAGLGDKDNYKRYPARMLWARASTNVIRDWAPSVAVGLVTEEEIDAEQPVYDGEYVELDQSEQYEAEQKILSDAEALERNEDLDAQAAAAAADDTKAGRQVKDEVGTGSG